MEKRTNARAAVRIMRAGDVTNSQLVAEIVNAARRAVPLVTWPKAIPKHRARAVVHRYLRDHTQYTEEGNLQVVRLPRAMVVQGVGDCKSSAVFAAALLRAAGFRVALRFIRQPSRPWLSHVYTVADGVAVDPLLSLGGEAERTAFVDYAII